MKQVALTEATHKKLKAAREKTGISIKRMVDDAIIQYLKITIKK